MDRSDGLSRDISDDLRPKAKTVQKEMAEAVSGCVDQMKAELMLQRIIDARSRSGRRSSQISRRASASSEKLGKEPGDLEIPEEPSTPGPNLGLSVSLGISGPRTSPALKGHEAAGCEELPEGEYETGVESITMQQVLSPRQIDHVQDAILINRNEHEEAHKLRLHKAWKFDEEPKLRSSASHSTSNSFLKMGSSTFSNGESNVRKSGSNRPKEEAFHWYDRLTVSHRSPLCMVWDIWTSIAIAYDMVMTPMDAFNIEITPVIRALERTSSITWTVDMFLSFFRSYGKLNGTEERHLRSTARFYLKTWFAFDFTLVCLDLFIFILEDSSWTADKLMRYMSFLRAIRLFRLLRVLRVAKVKARIAVLAQLLHILQTQRITDRGFLMLNIAKSLLVVTVINHFTACIWYAIATIMEDENNWVHSHFMDPTRPDSLLYLYTTAYHWSITQLTPASCEIYPYSARERIFNIAVILFGLCVFSSFISSMAQQLHALGQLNRADRHRMQILRRFISEHHMSVGLATTIVDFVRQKRGPQMQRPLKISDIESFNSFPTVLLQKIRSEAYIFVMSKHMFYKSVYDQDRECFNKLCNNAIFEETVDKGQEVFATGDEGKGLYFLHHGKLAYAYLLDDVSYDPTDSQDWISSPETSCFVSNNTFISEVAMWLNWLHRGRLAGEAIATDLLFVSVDRFREVVRASHILKEVRLYARLYALRALRAGRQGAELDDLWHEEEVIEEISKLSLQGGLEQAVNILAAGRRITPQKILRAWRHQAQSGRFSRRFKKPVAAWRRLADWLRCCLSAPNSRHDFA